MLTNLSLITRKMQLKLHPNTSNLVTAKINTVCEMSYFSF